MTDHYDELEIREPAERERSLVKAVAAQVAHAKTHAPAYEQLLKDVDPADIDSAEAIAKLPLTRKSALLELQRENLPLGRIGIRRRAVESVR